MGGCPILTYGNTLVTGSHRVAALQLLEDEWEDFDGMMYVATDVQDLIDEALEREGYGIEYLETDNLGWLLEGTFGSFAEAVKARKDAEEKYHQTIIDEYKKRPPETKSRQPMFNLNSSL